MRVALLILLLAGCRQLLGFEDVQEAADATSIVQEAYLKSSNSDANDLVSTVAFSDDGSTLAVGTFAERSSATGIDGNQNLNDALDAGAVYIFVRTGSAWAQEAYIKASNTNAGDRFGFVALSSTGSTLVAGAFREDSSASGVDGVQADELMPDAGAAYVFERTASGWVQSAYLKASNPDPGDSFGGPVAISGDGATIAIGAGGEDSSSTGIDGLQTDNAATDAGAVYVFRRSGTSWSQDAYIKASNTELGDGFSVVALSSDGTTLAVGARGEASGTGDPMDNSAPSSGAVYVFVRDDVGWSQQAYLKASNAETSDSFGSPIALTGDGSMVVVGAGGESGNGSDPNDNSMPGSGAVYVFERTGTSWLESAYLKATNPDPGDAFGVALAIDGTGSRLVVGAYLEDASTAGVGGTSNNDLTDAGAAYVFERAGQGWIATSYIKPSNPGGGDNFASGLALSGDGKTFAIGAPFEDSNARGVNGTQANESASNSGAIYVFRVED